MTEKNRSILTYTGRLVDAFDMKPEDIELAHIAHALATKTRFNGSATEPYSIAQHCCLAAAYANPELNKAVALLHDAAEAYFYDIAGPHKKNEAFEKYRVYEDWLQHLIFRKYLPTEVLLTPEQMNYRWVDHQLLLHECRRLLPGRDKLSFASEIPEIQIPIEPWSWCQAETIFLSFTKVLGLKD